MGWAEVFHSAVSPQSDHRRFLRFGRVANHQRKPKDQTMTDERQTLFKLMEKRADGDFVRVLLAFAAERLKSPVPLATGFQLGG